MATKQQAPSTVRIVSKTGNIGKMGDLKYSPKGVAWTTFSLAVSNDPAKSGKSGDKETDWFEVRCFYEQAEHVCECLDKGMRVIVKGTYEEDTWQGKDGKEHVSRIIMARDVGPSLKYATVNVTKVERRKPEEQQTLEDEEDF